MVLALILSLIMYVMSSLSIINQLQNHPFKFPYQVLHFSLPAFQGKNNVENNL